MTDRMSPDRARALVEEVLAGNATATDNARSVAAALVEAELIGQTGHGLRRLPIYADQAKSGKVAGRAVPKVQLLRSGALSIDAGNGFAFPALDLAVEQLPSLAMQNGIAMAGVYRSHHAGALGLVAERLAHAGVIALVFANTPKAMAPWGGKEALFGTNPIAFAAPTEELEPVVVDLSLSRVARGKIMVAKQAGESIPSDWALDEHGHPTTDPAQAAEGTMLPAGDAKGAALALMVELLAAGVTGAKFSYDASSFFHAEGSPPGVGQLVIALDPRVFAADAIVRITELLDRIDQMPGARVPGRRRQELRLERMSNGIPIDADLRAAIQQRRRNIGE